MASCGYYQEESVESSLSSVDVGFGDVIQSLKRMHIPKHCRWKVWTSVSSVNIDSMHELNPSK